MRDVGSTQYRHDQILHSSDIPVAPDRTFEIPMLANAHQAIRPRIDSSIVAYPHSPVSTIVACLGAARHPNHAIRLGGDASIHQPSSCNVDP
jgi:hypothetical protein